MGKDIVKIETELVTLGIEQLESRQEMALIAADTIEANSKCSENQSCNTAAGCGVSTEGDG